MIANIDSTYSIGLPDSWFEWTSALRFLGELDWANWLVPSACVVGSGLDRLLLLRSLAPLVVIMILPPIDGMVSVMKHWYHAFASKEEHTRRSIEILDGKHEPNSLGAATMHGLTTWLPVSLVLTFCFTVRSSASLPHAQTGEHLYRSICVPSLHQPAFVSPLLCSLR